MSGVASSDPGKDLSEGSDRCDSSIAAGQPDCSGIIYQQHGGHSVSSTQSPVVVGPVQGHCAGCRVYIRDSECCGRCQIQINDGQNRLEVAHQVLQQIDKKRGPLEMDLFEPRLTTQLPCFFSWRPDPLAEATDAFSQDWCQVKGYANPPWCLIGKVLSQVKSQKALVI